MKLKTLLLVCTLLFSMSAGAKEFEYTTVPGDLMKTRIYTLDNGLRVYLSVNSEKPRIQTFIAVRTGSKNDPSETTGLAHYLEHLMFKGTKQYGTSNAEAEAPLLSEIEQRYEAYRKLTDPEARRQAYHEIDSVSQLAAQYAIPNEYDKLMAAIGAQGTNAFTSNDVTCYTEDIPSNEIENWAKIQSDRFQNMVIRGFHTELEAVYEEYNIGLTQDSRKLFYAFSSMLWPNHPYGTQTTIGTQEHLKNPSITNIKNYFRHWYVPNNVAICMAGDFDPDKTIAIIDKYFSGWKPGADVCQPVFAPLTPLTQPRDTTIIGQEAEQIWLGWRAKEANALQQDTLSLIGEVLSNGRVGLFDLNLLQAMKVQDAFAGPEPLRDHGGFLLGGTPKEGQTLDEVKALMLGEIDKLKKGEFSDELLPAIIKNAKLNEQKALDDNRSRAYRFMEAFINEVDWQQEVEKTARLEKISKQALVDFANRYFTDAYIAVYKKQGVDSTQKKIDKPQITAIPANRDQISAFVQEVQNTQVEPIQPRFVDFKKDLTLTETMGHLPVVYKQNVSDDRFNLVFRYEFGNQADNRYDVAADYTNYLGTDKLTAAQLKEKFYQLACNYSISAGSEYINISLSGLSESMTEALSLLEDFMQNAKVDQDAYNQMVAIILKDRADAKSNQRYYFSALSEYGVFGPYNSYHNMMSEAELKNTDPQVLIDLISGLKRYEHSVLYYGPLSEKELSEIITKQHPTEKQLQPALVNKPYVAQLTPQNEVWIAPYEAKNIYMRMFHNENHEWNPEEQGIITLFNEYFGGGMNGIVFQELREARGLAYSCSAYYHTPSKKDDKERYSTYIIAQNDKMMDCVRTFHNILNQMPASVTAFQVSKDAATKQLASYRTTKFDVLNAYLLAQRLGIDYDLNEKVYRALSSIQLSDLVNFEQQRMANKPYRYIILGDEKELDMEALQQLGPIRRLTPEEVFGY